MFELLVLGRNGTQIEAELSISHEVLLGYVRNILENLRRSAAGE